MPWLDADLTVEVSVELPVALSREGDQLHLITGFVKRTVELKGLTGRIFRISETLNEQDRCGGLWRVSDGTLTPGV